MSVLVICEAQSGRLWTKLAGVAGVAGVPECTDTDVIIKHDSNPVMSNKFSDHIIRWCVCVCVCASL